VLTKENAAVNGVAATHRERVLCRYMRCELGKKKTVEILAGITVSIHRRLPGEKHVLFRQMMVLECSAIDSVFSGLVLDFSFANAQYPCGFALVSAGVPEGFLYHIALKPGQDLVEISLYGVRHDVP
jgi:hypothetical protein